MKDISKGDPGRDPVCLKIIAMNGIVEKKI